MTVTVEAVGVAVTVTVIGGGHVPAEVLLLKRPELEPVVAGNEELVVIDEEVLGSKSASETHNDILRIYSRGSARQGARSRPVLNVACLGPRDRDRS